MKFWLLIGLEVATALVMSTSASAVVIRDDIEDEKYQISDSEFPALANLPGEWRDVLVAPRRDPTVTHAVTAQHVCEIAINGLPRKVRRVFVHQGYQKLPDLLAGETLASELSACGGSDWSKSLGDGSCSRNDRHDNAWQ